MIKHRERNPNRRQRVVVTGMGCVTPLGLDTASTWQNLINGNSGIDYISLFDTKGYDTKIAAEVRGFDPVQYIDPKFARCMDRFTHFAIAASLQAVEHASLEINSSNAEEIGVIIGTAFGGLITISEQVHVIHHQGPSNVIPFAVSMLLSDTAAGQVSIRLGAKGPNYGIASACASGAHSIGDACDIISRGGAKAMIAGGSDAIICPLGVASLTNAGALSTGNSKPQKASRPFDIDRDGLVLAEGAACLVLESLDFALNRGAPILAEVIGYGATCDAYHPLSPAEGGGGAVRAMRIALRQANLEPGDIDYIDAHGTSTVKGDLSEAIAIKTVFNSDTDKIPVSATKSMLGHTIGASGAIQALTAIQVIQNRIIPPTINLDHPDPLCALNHVSHFARRYDVNIAMCNSFGFGGHNAVLIFAKFDDRRAKPVKGRSTKMFEINSGIA